MQGLRGLGADIPPGFRKHLKTKHRTQPRPPCTCLGFPAPLHFHHLESVAPFRDCQGDRASTDSPPTTTTTHTPFPTRCFQSVQMPQAFPVFLQWVPAWLNTQGLARVPCAQHRDEIRKPLRVFLPLLKH